MKPSILLSTTALLGLTKLRTGSSSGTSSASPSNETANEFLDGGCRPIIFFYARGSDQDGNIGDQPGPQVISLLKSTLGQETVAAQGIDYPALLLTNILPEGCGPLAASGFAELVTYAAGECPESKLVIAGYSQGAALVHAAAKRLLPRTAARVVAAVTFGDTRRVQDGGQIPPISPDRSLILCHAGDLVCDGTLDVTDAHFNYQDLAPTAVAFIASKV
ncbi:cutinase [Nemania sp. FL0916]|nr:cutinase [Nemania sp. FL0916]